jgi:hypothetical protein
VLNFQVASRTRFAETKRFVERWAAQEMQDTEAAYVAEVSGGRDKAIATTGR